jgi:hypothetical protein
MPDWRTQETLGEDSTANQSLPGQHQGHASRVFDPRNALCRIFGVDLTNVPGIRLVTAHTILCEVGIREG